MDPSNIYEYSIAVAKCFEEKKRKNIRVPGQCWASQASSWALVIQKSWDQNRAATRPRTKLTWKKAPWKKCVLYAVLFSEGIQIWIDQWKSIHLQILKKTTEPRNFGLQPRKRSLQATHINWSLQRSDPMPFWNETHHQAWRPCEQRNCHPGRLGYVGYIGDETTQLCRV